MDNQNLMNDKAIHVEVAPTFVVGNDNHLMLKKQSETTPSDQNIEDTSENSNIIFKNPEIKKESVTTEQPNINNDEASFTDIATGNFVIKKK